MAKSMKSIVRDLGRFLGSLDLSGCTNIPNES